MGFQHRKRASQRASSKKKKTRPSTSGHGRPKRARRTTHTGSNRTKSTLGSYNSQTPGGENQDDRENRILTLLRSGSYQSYIRPGIHGSQETQGPIDPGLEFSTFAWASVIQEFQNFGPGPGRTGFCPWIPA